MQKGIVAPNWIKRFGVSNITRSADHLQPLDIALHFALSIRIHNNAEALRRCARSLSDKVCYEQQADMKKIARFKHDEAVWVSALTFINWVCKRIPGAEEGEFTPKPPAKPTLEQQMAELAAEGHSRTAAANILGIDRRKFYDVCKLHPDVVWPGQGQSKAARAGYAKRDETMRDLRDKGLVRGWGQCRVG